VLPSNHPAVFGSCLEIINQVRVNKGLESVATMRTTDRLREDLGFDSMDMAELTVRLEQRFDVDVFADGVIATVGELLARLPAN
jgi:acyl carrier protein